MTVQTTDPSFREHAPSFRRDDDEKMIVPYNVDKEGKKTTWVCPMCRKIYAHKSNLMRHLRVECGKEPSQMCLFCSYKCKHKTDIMRHMRLKHKEFKIE
ncbi:hypothetical protein M8J76_007241 [Diaphorina citri]|nr:hypothetical protein M8J76_007241 [Diaphorina citri]KAI5742032.1 hypothetical protein M8J77_002331 [Diaphorina citri]